MESKKQKEKYHKDRGYRRRVIQKSLRYYHKNKKLKKAKPIRVTTFKIRPIIVEMKDGRRYSLYKIAHLASALAKTVAAIRRLILEGIIPRTPFKAGGCCLYTEEMIQALILAWEEMDFKYYLDKKKFKRRIAKRWPKITKSKEIDHGNRKTNY